MHVDDNGIVQSFLEKPADPPPMPASRQIAGQHGIYVFDSKFLFDELRRDATTRIRATISARTSFPISCKNGRAVAHQFSDLLRQVRVTIRGAYWRDAGTWMLTGPPISISPTSFPELDLYDRAWPIWTHAEITPPAKFVHDEDGRRGQAVTSLVSADASYPAPHCAARCFSPACTSIHTPTWKTPS
jgi:glucose-1-phosphate adenylyltransferase